MIGGGRPVGRLFLPPRTRDPIPDEPGEQRLSTLPGVVTVSDGRGRTCLGKGWQLVQASYSTYPHTP